MFGLKHTGAILAAILMASCGILTEHEESSTECQKLQSLVVLDTIPFSTVVKADSAFGVASYFLSYFGPVSDTMILDYSLIQFPPPPPPPKVDGSSDYQVEVDPYFELRELPNSSAAMYKHGSIILQPVHDSARIELFVDTTKTIVSLDFESEQRDAFAFDGYPVYISNISDYEAAIGYMRHLDLILEAKDESGLWKPIERHYKEACGVAGGNPTIILPPSYIAITSVPIFSGSFTTTMRLRQEYTEVCSNEFVGRIELSQLQQIYR